jgi:hypothetical protein
MKNKVNFKKDNPLLTDSLGVWAIGKVTINKNYKVSRLRLEFLEKAMMLAKQMNQETLDLCVADDSPVIFGHFNKRTGQVAGIVIAPQIDEEKA